MRHFTLTLALLVGACAGFLVFNYPRSPARDGAPRQAAGSAAALLCRRIHSRRDARST